MIYYMKKQIFSVLLILVAVLFSCDLYPYKSTISGIIQELHIADSAYYSNSKKLIQFNASNQKILDIHADTLMLKINGVTKEVVYIKSHTWQGKMKYGTQILKGLNTKGKTKSIRIHVKNLKKRGQRMFITSEIMDGEYNEANDTIWTYYKPNPD